MAKVPWRKGLRLSFICDTKTLAYFCDVWKDHQQNRSRGVNECDRSALFPVPCGFSRCESLFCSRMKKNIIRLHCWELLKTHEYRCILPCSLPSSNKVTIFQGSHPLLSQVHLGPEVVLYRFIQSIALVAEFLIQMQSIPCSLQN